MSNSLPNFINEIRYGTSTTYVLIGINVIVFLIVNFVRVSFIGINQNDLAEVFGGSAFSLVVYDIQWWRLITSTYLHIEWWHILINMFTLYSLGRFLETYYSSRKLFIVYLISGICGSFLALFDQGAITLGASGAIFGLMGLIVGNLLKRNTYSPGLPIKLNSVLYPALIWLVLSFGIGGISFLGHLGGFVSGILLGLIIDTANVFDNNTSKNRILSVLFIVSVALVVISFALLFTSIFF